MDYEELKKENEKLKRQIKIARKWMEKEVEKELQIIYKQKLLRNSKTARICYRSDNIEDDITNKIKNFFGEMLIINIPSNIIKYIISAEINYHNMQEHPNFDGLSVITSYHKALDVIIETVIIKGFRKYAIKRGCTNLRKNNSLEKSLHSVINKGYILSVGRLYHLLSYISQKKELFDYGNCFKDYLLESVYLKNLVLNPDFLNHMKIVIDSQILGTKRHKGTIKFVETRKARKILIGDLEDKDCIIYRLLESQKLDF